MNETNPEANLPAPTEIADPALNQRLDAIAQKDEDLQTKVFKPSDTFEAPPTSQEVSDNLDRIVAGPEQSKAEHPPAKPDAA